MKMNFVPRYGAFVLSIIYLAGCAIDQKAETYDLSSYIVRYKYGETIVLQPIAGENGVVGFSVVYADHTYCDWFWDRSSYETLCKKYEDLNYRRQITVWPDAGIYDFYGPCANARSYAKISVTTQQKWNAKYSEGSVLDGIVRLEGWTYYPFIRNGYTLPEPKTLITGYLDRIGTDTMIMLGTDDPNTGTGYGSLEICRLYFDAPPERPGTYPITVTLTTDEGEVFEARGEVTFPSDRSD